ncbi:MAG: hypothetical protein IJF92_01650 [Bacilli bacterium]|nr:hypothetical protein [Bacilli bacterium]
MVKNQKSNSSNKMKMIIGIVVAAVVALILILSLVSCQKKASSDDKKDKRVEEKDKKPKKKDKDKLTFTDEKDDYVVAYRFSETKTNISTSTSNSSSSTPSVTPVVVKYDTEVTTNGGDVTLEYKTNEYSEEGAKYTNKKNNTIVSSGDVTDIKVYKDGEEVDGLNIDSPVGEYSVVYSYTNPDGETVTASRTVTIEDTTAPTITSSKSITGNTATVTLTITDYSEIEEVSIVNSAGTPVGYEENYSFTTDVNDTFTVTAKDIYGNTSEPTAVTVNELITPEELDAALEISGKQEQTHENRWGRIVHDYYYYTITNNGASNVKYASTRRNYSSQVDTSTFENPAPSGKVVINGIERDVTFVTTDSTNITDQNTDQNYYIYYEYSNDAGATASNVKHIGF